MHTFTKQILLFEAVGFGLTLCLLWLNEALDLPNSLFGAPMTPINWRESTLESAVVLALAAGTLWWSYRALARIQYLEGLLRVCMFCKKINAGDEWVPVEQYIARHSEIVFSHGLCPECEERHYSKLSESTEQERPD